MNPSKKPRRSFEEHIQKGLPNECWPWTGYRTKFGYGVAYHKGMKSTAHRIAYHLAGNPLIIGLVVAHKCDNPPCCNPNHLFLATQKQNMDDCARKGRTNRAKFPVRYGEDHPQCKLSLDQCKEIRCLYETGNFSQDELADMFNVGQSQIGRIIIKQSRENL